MFLPMNQVEVKSRGWDEVDFVLVSGDAYIDHPSFGVAIISRVLEAFHYRVAILAQPDINNLALFKQFGLPKLGFLVTAGNIDSMVNHFTVAKKRREKDYYTPGGVMGKRPDDATITYTRILRRIYPHAPIILGGIEASLRRLGHYDYIKDRIRPSILIESGADLLVYGMAEKTIIEIADSLQAGLSIQQLDYIRGTVYRCENIEHISEYEMLPTFEQIKTDKRTFAESFNHQYRNTDAINAHVIVEPYIDSFVVQNKPALPLERAYFDWVYSLPYERNYPPVYQEHIPAIDEVKHSIIVNRGCFGNCSFCALTMHQGRIIQSRSKNSVVQEAKRIIEDTDFKGYIHDIGGPTANFYQPACAKQEKYGACVQKQCLHPNKCDNLFVSHQDYLDILKAVRSLDRVKKVFVRSGIRYDYLMYDKDDTFFKELVQNHISGQLKVAPEHINSQVLDFMQKPKRELFDQFVAKYKRFNQTYSKDQFLVPYLMSSHPGCDLNASIELAEYIRDHFNQIEQVQDFYPTPGTLATCMYYTELDPRNYQPIYVAKNPHDKAIQRALMQYKNPKNYDLVYEGLVRANRRDLIGYEPHCLIRPRPFSQNKNRTLR